MEKKLKGKVALVTGSDSGIGQASAIELAKAGADIVVTYHKDKEGAEKTLKEIEKLGQKAIIVSVDTSDEKSVDNMFDEAVREFGTVDILVNNAGVDSSGIHVADMATEVWDKAMKVNLYGYFFCCRRFINIRKKDGGGGKIIDISSIHEDIPWAGGADYDASKGGVRGLTRTLALEVAPLKINVNSVAPGMVLTPFNQKAIDDKKYYEDQVKNIPLKRAAQPEEIGKLVVFLASDDAAYVTGSTYTMDGGLTHAYGQGA